jgi:hypothetical protein
VTAYEKYPHPIDVRNHLIEIRVKSSIYMETGCLDHYTTAFNNHLIFKPSYLHYTPNLDTKAASEDGKMEKVKFFKQLSNNPKFSGETVARTNSIDYTQRDEGDTLAGHFSCDPDDYRNSVTVEGTPYFDGPYCPSTLWSGKRTAVAMPGSIYGSKLQMYLQAIWGSKRDDISLVDPVFTFFGLEVDGQSLGLPHAYNGSTYLYTAPDSGRYYLVNFSTTFGFIVKNINLTDSGNALRVWLKENPQSAEVTRELEAYILSTGTPEPGWWLIKPADELDDLFDKGSPFAYGLHANWDGDEARAVCIQRYDTATYGDSNPRWESTYFKVTLSLDSVSGPALDQELRDVAHRFPGQWTVGIETIQSDIFTGRTNEGQVFSPSPATGQSVGWAPKPGVTGANLETNDVLLYCTYDTVNRQFVEAKASDDQVPNGTQLSGPLNLPFFECGQRTDCETLETTTSPGHEIRLKIYSGGSLVDDYGGFNGNITAEAEGGTLNADFASIGAWQLGDNPSWVYPQARCELGDPDREIHRFARQTFKIFNHNVPFTYVSEWLLAIPYNCSDAFYAGDRHDINASLPSFIWNIAGCRLYQQAIMHGQGTPASPTATSGWIEGRFHWLGSSFDSFAVYSSTSFAGCLTNFTDPWNMDAIDMKLYVGDTETGIVCTQDGAYTEMSSLGQFTWPGCWYFQPSTTAVEGGSFDDGNWTLMFNAPLITDPYIEQILFVFQSINGNFFADKDPNGFSGTVKDENYDYDAFNSSTFTYIGHD